MLSSSEIKRLVETHQDPELVREAAPNLYNQYCERSYMPFGLVEKATDPVRYVRLPNERAQAVAGLMLDYSLAMPFSLREFWAMKSFSSLQGSSGSHERFGRYDILKTLAENPDIRTKQAVMEATGLRTTMVGQHLSDLGRLGVISYAAVASRTVNPRYSWLSGAQPKGELERSIYEILSRETKPVPRNVLVERLDRYSNEHSARVAIMRITKKMIEAGKISVEGGVEQTHVSRIEIGPEWMSLLSELFNQIGAIDSHASIRVQWLERGNAIINDSQTLTELIVKGFRASRVARTGAGETPRLRDWIQDELSQTGPKTSAELREMLGAGSSFRTLQSALSRLHGEGLLRLTDGVWSLAEEF